MQGLLRKMDVAELRAKDWFGGMIQSQERGTIVRNDKFEDTDEEYEESVVIPEVCTNDHDDKKCIGMMGILKIIGSSELLP